MMASFFAGLGPGGLRNVNQGIPQDQLNRLCLPGSNHGGKVPLKDKNFQVGAPYDKDNLTTFQGGSGGDAVLLLSFSLFFIFIIFFNLSFVLAYHALSWPKPAILSLPQLA